MDTFYITLLTIYMIVTLTMFTVPSINSEIAEIIKGKNYKIVYYISTILLPITIFIVLGIFLSIIIGQSLEEFINKPKN